MKPTVFQIGPRSVLDRGIFGDALLTGPTPAAHPPDAGRPPSPVGGKGGRARGGVEDAEGYGCSEIRNDWAAPPLQVLCTSWTLSAVEEPGTLRHLALWRLTKW